jgi:predicted dehydrogenase
MWKAFSRVAALTPAGGILNRSDVQLVGIVEPDQKLFESYAQRYHLPSSLHFRSIQEMVEQAHPRAVLVFTAPSEHRRVIEECAALGVHVMVEKPLTISYKDALAIQDAAQHGNIHVLVNLETSWYASNTEAFHLLKQGALGTDGENCVS